MTRSVARPALATAFVAGLGTLALAAPVQAAPGNDEVAGATSIPTLPAVVSGSTVDASVGQDEPSPLVVRANDQLVGIDRTVWFSYTATFDGNVLLDSCDSNFDNYVNVFDGAPGALKTIATKSNAYRDCNGDRLLFAVKRGVTYHVRIAAERTGSLSPQGGIFRLSLEPQTPPANDAFARATVLPGIGTGTFDAPLAFATTEFGERTVSGEVGSVWFRLDPTQSRPYALEIPGGSGSTRLQVFQSRGRTVNALRLLGSDVTDGSDAARLDFNALRGRRYAVRVSTTEEVPEPAKLLVTTNTARGAGLVITPERNTLSAVRSSGFRTTASCTRTCRASLTLLVSAADARRYRLAKRPRGPVRVGRLTGSLRGGETQQIRIPLDRAAARRLRRARRLHVTVSATVPGARGGAITSGATLR